MLGVIRKIKGKRAYFIDGKEVSESEFDRRMDAGRTGPPVARPRGMKRGYPIKSMAICVHPTQVQEAEAHAKKVGVPTEYTKDGSAIIRDASHRKALMKAQGLRDRNSYYGY